MIPAHRHQPSRSHGLRVLPGGGGADDGPLLAPMLIVAALLAIAVAVAFPGWLL